MLRQCARAVSISGDVRPDGHMLMEQGTVQRGMIVVFEQWRHAAGSDVARSTRGSGISAGTDSCAVRGTSHSRGIDVRPQGRYASRPSRLAPAMARRRTTMPGPCRCGCPIPDRSCGSSRSAPDRRDGSVRPASRRFRPRNSSLTASASSFPAGSATAAPRLYVQALDGGAPQPVTEEGFVGALLSPDEQWVAAIGPSGPVLVPLEGGAPMPVRGLQPGETMRRWTSDGQIFVAAATPTDLRIERLNPWTGARTTWRQTSAPAFTGMRISAPFITPDGSAYTYGYGLSSSDLYVVTGVR